jgi:hypothetical protein
LHEYFLDQNLMEVNSLGINGLLNFEEFKLKLRLVVAGFSFSCVLFFYAIANTSRKKKRDKKYVGKLTRILFIKVILPPLD